ncbi:bifunctional folate synthesis protein [Reticulomyxa filosa]|uniref:dihydroneopterin aldolase n=1 Tax=Reticulomyxa filosa TaxID=46433 RepID=X6MRH1_RETFI|nr:bifunctional folate synthesis protein [Reticulomyxa filosa]|eukprot:ETO15705.1 bifunctional folate synthesis protein [Reticulomyxa filosa]
MKQLFSWCFNVPKYRLGKSVANKHFTTLLKSTQHQNQIDKLNKMKKEIFENRDHLKIKNLSVHGYIGDTPVERQLGQRFDISLWLYFDSNQCAQSDRLTDTIDYCSICADVRQYINAYESQCEMIEKACEDISKLLFKKYKILEGLKVTICKPNVIDVSFCNGIEFTISRIRENYQL